MAISPCAIETLLTPAASRGYLRKLQMANPPKRAALKRWPFGCLRVTIRLTAYRLAESRPKWFDECHSLRRYSRTLAQPTLLGVGNYDSECGTDRTLLRRNVRLTRSTEPQPISTLASLTMEDDFVSRVRTGHSRRGAVAPVGRARHTEARRERDR